jgi:hypothetical protein
MDLRMKLALLISIAMSLVAGPVTAVASCSMLNPCHDGHSCCPQHESDPVPQNCLISCTDYQALVPAKLVIATPSLPAMLPVAVPLPPGSDLENRALPPVGDSSRYLRLCVLRR